MYARSSDWISEASYRLLGINRQCATIYHFEGEELLTRLIIDSLITIC